MNRIIFLILLFVYASGVELKVVKSISKGKILKVKKIDNKIYFIRDINYALSYPLKDFFVLDGVEVDIGSDNKKIVITIINTNNKVVKKIVIKGKFVKAIQKGKFLYIATANEIYKIDKNLDYKIILHSKIDNLLKLNNKIYFVKDGNILSLNKKPFYVKHLGLMYEIVKYTESGNKLFVIYKTFDLVSPNKYRFFIKNLTNNYEISLDFYPKRVFYIDKKLYVVGYEKVEIYENRKKISSFNVNEDVLNITKFHNKVYLFFPTKIVYLKNLRKKVNNSVNFEEMECVSLDDTPKKMLNFKNYILVVFKNGIAMYDKNFNLIFKKKIDAKINNAKIIDDFIYLVGSKKAAFWIAKLDTNGNILTQKKFYKVAQGFDIVKNSSGFWVVGYKYFDHLGDFIKRMIVLKLKKNLDFILDKAFGNDVGVFENIFKIKNYYLVTGRLGDYVVVSKFNYLGNLIWYKILDKGAIFDVKKIKDKILISTNFGIFIAKNMKLTKYNDYKEAVIIDSDKFILNNKIVYRKKTKKFKKFDIYGGFYNKMLYIYGEKDEKFYICKFNL